VAVLALLVCGVVPALGQYARLPPYGDPRPPTPCQLGLSGLAQFQHLPLLMALGACGAVDPVLLQSVILPDRSKVAVKPPATLRCGMALAVAAWVREEIAPAALRLGAALSGLENADSYDCRGRNRVPGAMMSEHGRANALDIGGLRLADGRLIRLTDIDVSAEWRTAVRTSACTRFNTVLGPGSDGHHEEHIHLDLAERHGGYKMCHWVVREPVLEPVVEAKNPDPAPQAGSAAARIEDPVPLPRPRPRPPGAARIAAKPLKILPLSR
jgi:hypothetical protein